MALQTSKVDAAMRLRSKLYQMKLAVDRVRGELEIAEQRLNKEEAHAYGVRNGSIRDKRLDNAFKIGRPKGAKGKKNLEAQQTV